MSGLNFSGSMAQFVTESEYIGKNIIDICKNPEGVESNIVGENNMSPEDVKKALVQLKIKMKEKEIKGHL